MLLPNFNFLFTFILLSANVLNLDQSKILSFGNELNNAQFIICICFEFGPIQNFAIW